MKKVIYIASLCLASLFVSSCDDYLTLESPDQLTSEVSGVTKVMHKPEYRLHIRN